MNEARPFLITRSIIERMGSRFLSIIWVHLVSGLENILVFEFRVYGRFVDRLSSFIGLEPIN